MDITVSAVTATTATLAFGGVPGGTAFVEVQYSTDPDFQWSLAPIVRANTTAGTVLNGLNQVQTYYARARPLSAGGVVGAWSAIVGIVTPVSALRDLSPANVMIEPALIIPPERVLAWTASSEVPGYPVRTLGRDDPNSTWWAERVGVGFAFEAQIAPTPIDVISVLETNASDDATITIKGGPSLANVRSGAPAYTLAERPFRVSTGLPGRRAYHSFVRLPAPQAYPFWRIEIAGPIPGEIFVATYAVFGLAYSTRNFAADSKSETLIDRGSIDRDRSGNPARVDGHRGRSVEFEIVNMTEAQYESQFSQLGWKLGTTRSALVVPNSKPGAFLHDRLLFGTMKAGRDANTYTPRFAKQFSIDSLI